MTNMVEQRCTDCPHPVCRPSLSPSGFMCVRKLAEQLFNHKSYVKPPEFVPPPTVHGFIGSVPERSPARAPEPFKPPTPDPIEDFYRIFQQGGGPKPISGLTADSLQKWQLRYMEEACRQMREAAGRRNVEPISWQLQNRLNALCGRSPHIAKAWTAFTAGSPTLNDDLIKRWVTSVMLVNDATEEAGKTMVAKLRSIYGMLHNAAKELLDVFPEAMAKDDVASLRDVVDELEAMVHDAEQLMAASAPTEEVEEQ